MAEAEINIKGNQDRFNSGDTISGAAHVTLPVNCPLSNSLVVLSFNCESVDFNEMLVWDEADSVEIKHDGSNEYYIPFAFSIPSDDSLFANDEAFIQCNVTVAIKMPNKAPAKFVKQISVQAPVPVEDPKMKAGSAEVMGHA